MRVCGDAFRSTRLRLFLVVAISMLGVQLASPAAHAGAMPTIDITACPATVPAHSIGSLANDVACSTGNTEFPKYGIVLGKDSQLALNGHTVSYVPSLSTDGPVLCLKSCTVSDGTLTSPGGGSAVHVNGRGKLTARTLDISGFDYGLFAAQSPVNVSDTSISATVGGIWYTGLDHTGPRRCEPVRRRGLVSVHRRRGPLRQSAGPRRFGHGLSQRRVGCTRRHAHEPDRHEQLHRRVLRAHDQTYQLERGRERLCRSLRRHAPNLVNTTCDTSLHFRGKTASGNWGVCAND